MTTGFPSKIGGWLLACCLLFGFGLENIQASEGGHNDPTTANASAAMSNPLELRTDFAIFSLLVFLGLLAVLYSLAWKPLMKGLDLRERMIASQVEEARTASEKAAAKLKEYEAKLADAAVQAQELVNQAKRDAESVAERIKADAQANATRIIERAKAEIETAKQAALSELSTKSTDLAFGLARKVIGRELQSGDHQRLINEALGRLPSDN